MFAADKESQVFMSYASKDRAGVIPLANELQRRGVPIWRDQEQILGGENYGPKIVKAIRSSRNVIVCCSDAAMRSKNVKQEIQLAWHYNIPTLPVLLEPVSYHEQVEYWLTGWQYVELFRLPVNVAASQIIAGLHSIENSDGTRPADVEPHNELEVLWNAARLTDQIWPIPADVRLQRRAGLRDLGAPQDNAQFAFSIGSQVQIAIESESETNLLLLNKGTSGKLYCLCPSLFAPLQWMTRGLNILPQKQSRYPSFAVTGRPGRENLLAILSAEPVGAQWMPSSQSQEPALVLSANDVDQLVRALKGISADRWTALATYFEIVAS
jgi:TIR domain-containing protein/uncharacterized protein DUF4384